MPRYDFKSQRLFTKADLSSGITLDLDRAQANYLLNVLRLKQDAPILLFNGRDGEWQAHVQISGRKKASLLVGEKVRPQTMPYELHYLFAPIKQARLEYMVQKAVEMGVGVLQPVLTDFTQNRKLNQDRMEAYVIEAAEQCGILNIADVRGLLGLKEALEQLAADIQVIFCDEGHGSQNPLEAIAGLKSGPLVVLIGPEGGFSEPEREMLNSMKNVTPIPLGPRVLRADTAAVAALALVQAHLGDWRD